MSPRQAKSRDQKFHKGSASRNSILFQFSAVTVGSMNHHEKTIILKIDRRD